MREILEETHITYAQTQAPGSRQRGSQYGVTSQGPGAQGGNTGQTACAFIVFLNVREPFGAIGRVVIITAAVPAVKSGGTPIKLIFCKQGSVPALTV